MSHLLRLTDDTGLIQHANWHCPNYHEGYATDDNARALAFCIMYAKSGHSVAAVESLLVRYLSFLEYAFNSQEGRFRNFLAYERRWLEAIGSEDSQARALWALCVTAVSAYDLRIRQVAEGLLEKSLPAALSFVYPRPWAYTLIGCRLYLQDHEHRLMRSVAVDLAERLLKMYYDHKETDWNWFEPQLTYCNAVLSHGMLAAGQLLDNAHMTLTGLDSLRWLVQLQQGCGGVFSPIGSDGFYFKGQRKARFIQQPVEAYTTLDACLEAYRVTKEKGWLDHMCAAADWFLGRNDLNVSLYDPDTGGCQDGLRESGVNPNQGAESTLSYLFTALEMNSLCEGR